MTDLQSLNEALSAGGLAEYAEILVRHAQFAAHLRHADNLAPGRSKLGGRPDFPAGLRWPIREALQASHSQTAFPGSNYGPDQQTIAYLTTPQPLNFLAQIDLAQVAGAAVPGLELPRDGMLYFYYDTEHQGWGFDPADAPGFKVIFTSDTGSLRKLDPPQSTIPLARFKEVPLQPHSRFCPLPGEGIVFDRLKLPKAAVEIYRDLLSDDENAKAAASDRRADRANHANHQLGGYPCVIQNPMEEECALVAAGLGCGNGTAYSSVAGKSVLARENDWQLLFQIDSTDAADMMWGDCGMLYFWIRKPHLQARDFSQVWLILQCY